MLRVNQIQYLIDTMSFDISETVLQKLNVKHQLIDFKNNL